MSHTLKNDGWSMIGNPDLSGVVTLGRGDEYKISVPGELLRRWFETYQAPGVRRDVARQCASMAENCAHSCVSEEHCDFLHAAHSNLAKSIREKFDE